MPYHHVPPFAHRKRDNDKCERQSARKKNHCQSYRIIKNIKNNPLGIGRVKRKYPAEPDCKNRNQYNCPDGEW